MSTLALGERISITAVDDDVFADDVIGSGSMVYEGREGVITAGGATVTCRPISAEIVGGGRVSAQRRLEEALARLGTPRPDLDAADLGYPTRRARAVLHAVTHTLAWSEEVDPAVDALIEEAAAFEDAWEDALELAIDTAVADLAPVGDAVELPRSGRLTVTPLVCGDAADELRRAHPEALRAGRTCLLTVTLEMTRSGALASYGDRGLTVRAISDLGATTLRRVAWRHNERWLPLGGRFRHAGADRFFFVYEVPPGVTPRFLLADRRHRSAHLACQPGVPQTTP